MGGGAKVGARPPLEIPPKKIMCASYSPLMGTFSMCRGLWERAFSSF